jgi:hypothetical protein
MAKRKADGKEETGAATVGGEAPEPAADRATVEGGPEGTAVYPPPASDTSGERTVAGVPPQKQLPPDAPDGGAGEATFLRAENAALRKVVANLGGNPDEVAKAATANLGEPEKPRAATGPTFRMYVPGTGYPELEVQAPDEDSARREYLAKLGIVSMPQQPVARKGP